MSRSYGTSLEWYNITVTCGQWAKGSNMLAPLSDLVGECGKTKTTRKHKVKKKPWQWNSIHQEAFDNV
jgi:hypothetical protein